MKSQRNEISKKMKSQKKKMKSQRNEISKKMKSKKFQNSKISGSR